MSAIVNTSRKERVKKLREFHQSTLDELGVSDAVFMPKMSYKPTGMAENHIGFFHSEINKGHDIFVEFCNREDVPEFENRTLYKWVYNPHFDEEYARTEPSDVTGHHRYLIPIVELVKMKEYVPGTQSQIIFEPLPDANLDLPISDLTIRDLAAILLKKPVSTKLWLNEIITK